PCTAINDMHDIFWICLGYAPKFLRHGSPDKEQERVARLIIRDLDPKSFASAMASAVPRDLENLARSFEVIHAVDANFIPKIVSHLSETAFFKSTQDDWKKQSDELDHIIRFFSPNSFEPAASWIRKNKNQIQGPLKVLFACIAPDVAIE